MIILYSDNIDYNLFNKSCCFQSIFNSQIHMEEYHRYLPIFFFHNDTASLNRIIKTLPTYSKLKKIKTVGIPIERTGLGIDALSNNE